jgi:short-subunit dehydrogenase
MNSTSATRVAAITGASSGLGAELARQLALEGWSVGLTARREPDLERLASEIRARGGTAFVAPADAADPIATREALMSIAQALGPVDLLIANAGVGLGTTARKFSAADISTMIQVNLTGAVHAIEAVLPGMIERKRGRIVGVSSLAAFRGLPGSPGYCATKAGLTALLEGLRPELRVLGIGVTTVHPGYIRTPMTANQTGFQPLLMDVESAARIILRGVARGKSKINFPRRMTWLLRLVQLLPDPVYDRLTAGLLMNAGLKLKGKKQEPA